MIEQKTMIVVKDDEGCEIAEIVIRSSNEIELSIDGKFAVLSPSDIVHVISGLQKAWESTIFSGESGK